MNNYEISYTVNHYVKEFSFQCQSHDIAKLIYSSWKSSQSFMSDFSLIQVEDNSLNVIELLGVN